MNCKTFARQVVMTLSLVLTATGALAAPPTYQLQVDGLSCPFCAYGIEKNLSAIKGVEHLETNIKDGTVTITMKNGATLDEAAAKQAVKEAGFSLRKLEQVQPSSPGTPADQTN